MQVDTLKAHGRATLRIVKSTIANWTAHRTSRMAAALAYYTIFSIAPMLIVAVWVAGLVFGERAVEGQLAAQMSDAIGEQAAEFVETTVANAATSAGNGLVASITGIGLLIYASTKVFTELQDALNEIWEARAVAPKGIVGQLRMRAIAFAMVMVMGLLLMLVLLAGTVVRSIAAHTTGWIPGAALFWRVGEPAISLSILILIFATMFRYLPALRSGWVECLAGGALSAVMLSAGRVVLGTYLGSEGFASAYGAASSLVVLIVWVFYAAQILFMGAELAHTLALERGTIDRSHTTDGDPPTQDGGPSVQTETSGVAEPDEADPDCDAPNDGAADSVE